jgi:hypothetical protein
MGRMDWSTDECNDGMKQDKLYMYDMFEAQWGMTLQCIFAEHFDFHIISCFTMSTVEVINVRSFLYALSCR